MVTAPPIFDAPPLWTRPRGSKGAYLKEETKRNIFPLYSSVRFVTIVFLETLLRSRRETEGEGGSSRGAAT